MTRRPGGPHFSCDCTVGVEITRVDIMGKEDAVCVQITRIFTINQWEHHTCQCAVEIATRTEQVLGDVVKAWDGGQCWWGGG